MAKSRFSSPPKQQTPAMQTSHTYTVAVGLNSSSANDDDDDICPVCDGECTCDNSPRHPHPLSSTASVRPIVSSSASSLPSQPAQTTQPSLKIRLTVPPSVLGKIRAIESNSKKTKSSGGILSASGNDLKSTTMSPPASTSSQALSSSHRRNLQSAPAPKRRGRPPKLPRETAAAITSDVKGNAVPTFSDPVAQPSSSKRNAMLPQNIGNPKKTKSIAARRTVKLKGKCVSANLATVPSRNKRVFLSESSSSDLTDLDDDIRDDRPARFPAFVPASAISSSSNDSNSSPSSSDFDTDSSIEAEEENFIISEESRAHDKARVRRELLGRDDPPKKRDVQNDWVIRPRKKSVGSSGDDVEMDGESDDVTEDEEDEEDGESDEDEPDGRRPGDGYAGVATGWSDDDDESSFDADLFFANLSDDQDSSQNAEGADDDNQSDDAAMDGLRPPHGMARHEMNDLLFEVTEGWDGQIVFTNGLREGQGMLDIDFEVNAAQLGVESGTSSSQDSEADVQMTDGEDGEYEGDEFDQDDTDGETTEEELVDEKGLPTERAMRLFRLPSSVSAINPMSTLSPTTSPGPKTRRFKSHRRSPKPADILAGKVYWDDLDDMADEDERTRSVVSLSRNGMPVMGQFDPSTRRRAIIDGSSKEIPSPYPRRRRSRGRSTSSFGSCTRDGSLMLSPSSSLSGSSFRIMSSEDLVTTTSGDVPIAESIDLDDVLDSSFLDSDTSDTQVLSSASTEVDSRKHMRNLSRWDVISVGAFRQTTGNGESLSANWASDVGTTPSYENMMKTNALGTMIFDDKTSSPPDQSLRGPNASVKGLISPGLLPVHDGDRTPTNTPPNQIPQPPPIHHHHQHHHSHQKTRKELKKEKKMKRKNYGPVNQHHGHHHHHQHYPNMKTRSSSSMQRSHFFSSPSSSVPALNL